MLDQVEFFIKKAIHPTKKEDQIEERIIFLS